MKCKLDVLITRTHVLTINVLYLIIILCTLPLCSKVNEFSLCRYTINKHLNEKKSIRYR